MTKTAAPVMDESIDLSVPAATARWRAWAEQLSQGGPQPPSRVVLDTALVLRIHDPGAALAADAAIIREVRGLEARATAIRDQVDAARDEYGGINGVKARLREVRAELERLTRLDGVHPRLLSAGLISGQASRIRTAHPRLFPAPAAKAQRRNSK